MLEENKKKILLIGAIVIAILIGGIVYYFIQNEEEEYVDFEGLENSVENVVQNEMKSEIVEQKIVVHISGQVAKPGVINLKEGARLIDAINEAGGLTSEADISKINLAYVLEDAQKIYIPSVKEKEEMEYISSGNGDGKIVTGGSGQTSNKKEEKLMVNINTAKEEELMKLDGIGSSIATRIITYRKENGKFNTIEDIKNVSGIGEAKFNKIRNCICVK